MAIIASHKAKAKKDANDPKGDLIQARLGPFGGAKQLSRSTNPGNAITLGRVNQNKAYQRQSRQNLEGNEDV